MTMLLVTLEYYSGTDCTVEQTLQYLPYIGDYFATVVVLLRFSKNDLLVIFQK